MFRSHNLNQLGQERATAVRDAFEDCLEAIEGALGTGAPPDAMREMALVRTKLQEASFFAVRAVALDAANQERPDE